jgi:hypothetical protein
MTRAEFDITSNEVKIHKAPLCGNLILKVMSSTNGSIVV